MTPYSTPHRIALIGGGPAALFTFQQLVATARPPLHITLFERQNNLGTGMPYGHQGASAEHVTNVSDNEIPSLVQSMADWLAGDGRSAGEVLGITPENFNEYKVVPRLLFGQYLQAQFAQRLQQARDKGFTVDVFTGTEVQDAQLQGMEVVVKTADGNHRFDALVNCTGHHWPKTHEGTQPGWFDSPYPPKKLEGHFNHRIALRGASLTAIDAIRTLARCHGHFVHEPDGQYSYVLNADSPHFHMVMHSNNGLLPGLRFHLEDSQLGKGSMLGAAEVEALKNAHGGFVPLDHLFDRHYKQPIRETDPDFYEEIKTLNLEAFVEKMMALREKLDAFTLLKAEYKEAEKSIRRRQSVHWKERLGVLSYALNYPAKHLCAEDMLRLKKVLMPLISVIIAYIPQSSARELLALHEAGVLSLQIVDKDSQPIPAPSGGCVYHFTDEDGKARQEHYPLYVNCVGQPPMQVRDYPLPGLVSQGVVSQAYLEFGDAAIAEKMLAEGNKDVRRDEAGRYWLCVPGIAINDHFQVLNQYGGACPQVFNLAVPYMGGLNPDYSGLDFCEAAAKRVVAAMGWPVDEEASELAMESEATESAA